MEGEGGANLIIYDELFEIALSDGLLKRRRIIARLLNNPRNYARAKQNSQNRFAAWGGAVDDAAIFASS